jgi:hypothetical protein
MNELDDFDLARARLDSFLAAVVWLRLNEAGE